jgi:dihydrofolate reductase
MRELKVFNNISLDGYFADAHSDMSWAHNPDPQWNAFIQDNAQGDAEFLFGRITYQMMASFWPTPHAIQMMPTVAHRMNSSTKYVFSKTLKNSTWNNTQLFTTDLTAEVRKLKSSPGPDLMIFGSGTLISQLAQENLIDEYQLIIHPLILGAGKSMFANIPTKLPLTLTQTRPFQNGNVFLTYRPTASV